MNSTRRSIANIRNVSGTHRIHYGPPVHGMMTITHKVPTGTEVIKIPMDKARSDRRNRLKNGFIEDLDSSSNLV